MPRSCASSAIAAASRARNPSSPSISKITGIFTPQRRSISWSLSRKRSFSRRASTRPTVVLPAPIRPTK
jgi:hypothetical protein